VSAQPKHTCDPVHGSLGCYACHLGVPYDWSKDPGKILAKRVMRSLRRQRRLGLACARGR